MSYQRGTKKPKIIEPPPVDAVRMHVAPPAAQSPELLAKLRAGIRNPPLPYAFPCWELQRNYLHDGDNLLRCFYLDGPSIRELAFLQSGDGWAGGGVYPTADEASDSPAPHSDAAYCLALDAKWIYDWLMTYQHYDAAQVLKRKMPEDAPPFSSLTDEQRKAVVRANGLAAATAVQALELLLTMLRDPNTDFVWAERRYRAIELLTRYGIHP